jgi:serine/threonine protein kinase
MLAEI